MITFTRAALLIVLGLIALASCGGDEGPIAVDRLKCEALAAKDSYHFSSRSSYVVKDTGVGATPNPTDLVPFDLFWEVEADVIDGGGSAQAHVKTGDGGGRAEKDVIEIGSEFWTTLGEGTDYVQVEGVDGVIPFPPDGTCQALVADLDISSMTGVPEKVNGISSLKYDVEGLSSTALADAPAIGSASDAVMVIREYNGAVWVASDGYISKLDLAGTGEYEGGRRTMSVELKFEYADINGVDTKIVAPIPR